MEVRVVLNQQCNPCVTFNQVISIIETTECYQIIFTHDSKYYKYFNKLSCNYKKDDVKHIKILEDK